MPEQYSSVLDETVARIARSAALAIVLPQVPRLEIAGSAVALTSGLRRLGKTVSVFGPPMLPPAGTGSWGIAAENEPLREFIISLDLTRSPIKELKYERDQNRLNVIISPTGSRIRREDVTFRYGPLRYELVITLGVPAIESAAANIVQIPELLYETPIVNIDADPLNTRYGEVNLIPAHAAGHPNPTLPETVYRLLSALKAELDEESATALLAALVSATRGLKPLRTSAEAFRMTSELIRRGGDLPTAVRALMKERALAEEQLAARAVARSRMDEERSALWSFLSADDFAKTALGEKAAPAVLETLLDTLPQLEHYVLLWHDTAANSVQGLIACRNPAEADSLRQTHGLREQDGFLALREPFASFSEAEAAMRRLLQDGDAVQ